MPISGMLEVVEIPLYDTVGLPRPSADAEMPRVELFADPIGQMGKDWSGHYRVKSDQDTNLYDPKMLPFPQEFKLRSIRAALVDVGGDLMCVGTASRFYRSSILKLWIGQKLYWQGPLWKVADPATMFLPADVLKVFTVEERAELIRGLRHQFEYEETSPMIRMREQFYCTVDFDPLLAGWTGLAAPSAVTVLLEGQLARPAQ